MGQDDCCLEDVSESSPVDNARVQLGPSHVRSGALFAPSRNEASCDLNFISYLNTTLSGLSNPCLVAVTGAAAVYVGRNGTEEPQLCFVSLNALPRFYLIRVFRLRCAGTFQRATNVKILVVVKGPACVSHLSLALNSKPNSPTRRLTLHSDSRAMADVQGKFLIPHQPSQARPIPTMS